ncbi:nucleotidyltransferase domain-containing protein [Cohnella massiliensis]|uniref:nucleotidyltransferase domain-containing protein n=1 Tax=Cohnella massiliensis TaxID=1816691 RepID=UPI0009BB29B8|nr:hypothetical protein [Cohnella massiliensis]
MLTPNLELAAERLAELTRDCGVRWIVGGSAALAMRGAELGRPPRDLDIYADAQDIPVLHRRLSEAALDRPTEDRTGRYRSVLSHYDLMGTTVELVGAFRVGSRNSVYNTEVAAILYPMSDRVRLAAGELALAPLGHELLFNLLRERYDRVETVAGLIRANPEAHLAGLRRLLERNRLASDVAEEARRLAGIGEKGDRADDAPRIR